MPGLHATKIVTLVDSKGGNLKKTSAFITAKLSIAHLHTHRKLEKNFGIIGQKVATVTCRRFKFCNHPRAGIIKLLKSLHLKSIVQRILRGVNTKLKNSVLVTWRPDHFSF
jgi:hypothetical protein